MPPRRNAPAPDTLTDPVQWASHYWRQQVLAGDEQRFLVMGALLRYQRIVLEHADSALRALELNMTDYMMLMNLQLSESGTRLVSTLARNLLVHATTATLAADRLEGVRAAAPQPAPHRPAGHLRHHHRRRARAGAPGHRRAGRRRLRAGRRLPGPGRPAGRDPGRAAGRGRGQRPPVTARRTGQPPRG
jgi:hypothetical protein